MTLAQQAQTDKVFIQYCEKAGVQPTKRQKSKWNNKEGQSWEALRNDAWEKGMAPIKFYNRLGA